jgi:hypothetical protein
VGEEDALEFGGGVWLLLLFALLLHLLIIGPNLIQHLRLSLHWIASIAPFLLFRDDTYNLALSLKTVADEQ